MNIQNRTTLQERYHVNRRFEGITIIGSYEMWMCLGQFIDFQGSRNHLHKHSFYEACLVLDGQGEFIVGDDCHKVCKGDLFIADPGNKHEIISSKDHSLCIHFVSFSFFHNSSHEYGRETDAKYYDQKMFQKSVSDQKISTFIRSHRPLCHNCDDLGSLFMKLHEISLNESYEDWYFLSESVMRYLVVCMITSSVEAPTIISGNYLDPRITIAKQFIYDNIQRRLSVEEIAWHANTSTRTLRRLFKEHLHASVINIYNNYRIEEAEKIINSYPHRSISNIGFSLGFDNPSDFSRAFKKMKGISPKAYRARNGTSFIEKQ